jgi:hypothetical protein
MLIKVQIYNDLASPVEKRWTTKYRREPTALSAIHVRLIQVSILLHRNRRDVVDGALPLPLNGRNGSTGAWQRPVFFSLEVWLGGTRTGTVHLKPGQQARRRVVFPSRAAVVLKIEQGRLLRTGGFPGVELPAADFA